MSIKDLLKKYVGLNNLLESKGGRTTEVIGNEEMEKLYEQIFELENVILEKYRLPQLVNFRLLLIDFVDEDKSEEVFNNLTVAAWAFLN